MTTSSVLDRFLQILASIGPLVLGLIPETAPYAGLVTQGIAAAETMAGASGAQKKAAALQIITTGMTAANSAVGHVIVDPAALTSLVSTGIDTTVAAVNLVQNAHP